MIGQMRHLLTLQQKAHVSDGHGGYVQEWQDVEENAGVFAAIETLSARENLREHKIQAAASHRITMRYRSDVTAEMRLLEGQVAHEIVAVIDADHRREYLQVYTVSQS
jgi:SPP1 family predicted phage head-tail adaptor